jgi:hypothetical protein
MKGASLVFLSMEAWALSGSQQGRLLHVLQDTCKKVGLPRRKGFALLWNGFLFDAPMAAHLSSIVFAD